MARISTGAPTPPPPPLPMPAGIESSLRPTPPPPAGSAAPTVQVGFFGRVLGCFAYPLRDGGLLRWILASVLYFICMVSISMSARGLIISAPLFGYLCTYLLNMANASGDGNDTVPSWPEIGLGLAGTFFMFVMTVVLVFLPPVAYIVFSIWKGIPLQYVIVLLFLSVFLLPMALMRVSMLQSLEALNPLVLLRSIGRVLTPYMGLCLVMTFVNTLESVASAFASLIPVPYVGLFINAFLSFYALMVTFRLLGLFYFIYRKELDWLSHLNPDAPAP